MLFINYVTQLGERGSGSNLVYKLIPVVKLAFGRRVQFGLKNIRNLLIGPKSHIVLCGLDSQINYGFIKL